MTDDTVGQILSARVANPRAITEAAATSLPILLLGGEATVDDTAVVDRWRAARKLPAVRGMVIGRALLYPPGGDVASVVDRTVGLP